jgi:hypothetical protein
MYWLIDALLLFLKNSHTHSKNKIKPNNEKLARYAGEKRMCSIKLPFIIRESPTTFLFESAAVPI